MYTFVESLVLGSYQFHQEVISRVVPESPCVDKHSLAGRKDGEYSQSFPVKPKKFS